MPYEKEPSEHQYRNRNWGQFMQPSESIHDRALEQPVVLIAGATGFGRGRVIPLLEQQPVTLRCLARKPEKLIHTVKPLTEVAYAAVLDVDSLASTLRGVQTAH